MFGSQSVSHKTLLKKTQKKLKIQDFVLQPKWRAGSKPAGNGCGARKMDHVFFSILGLCLNHQSLSLSQSLLSLEKKKMSSA